MVAQKEAGNYKKHHISFQGLPISIENPKGTLRKGDGWKVREPSNGYDAQNEVQAHKALEGSQPPAPAAAKAAGPKAGPKPPWAK